MSSHAPNQARVIPLRPVAAAAAPAPKPAAREPLWRHIVGDVLRRERLARERTLRDVADAAVISMPYLSELERGRKEASSEVLAAAAHALGLGLGDLLALSQGELARLAQARSAKTRAAPTRATPATSVNAVNSARSLGSVRVVAPSDDDNPVTYIGELSTRRTRARRASRATSLTTSRMRSRSYEARLAA